MLIMWYDYKIFSQKRYLIISIIIYRGKWIFIFTGYTCIILSDILYYDSIMLNSSCLLMLRWAVWPMGLLFKNSHMSLFWLCWFTLFMLLNPKKWFFFMIHADINVKSYCSKLHNLRYRLCLVNLQWTQFNLHNLNETPKETVNFFYLHPSSKY